MGNIYCQKCGEVWDSYGITYCIGEGDLTPEETRRFRRGDGCPTCSFGEICTHCHGSGIEPCSTHNIQGCLCPTCRGNGYVYAKRCETAPERYREWFIGYGNSPKFPIRHLNEHILRMLPQEHCADGFLQVAQMVCPDCKSQGKTCCICGGDGKLMPVVSHKLAGVESLCEASDEDPILLIMETGP
jgi:hypothetical protein